MNTTNFIAVGDKTIVNLDAISYIKPTPAGGLTIVFPATAESEKPFLNIKGTDAQTLLGELQKRGIQIPRGLQDAANKQAPSGMQFEAIEPRRHDRTAGL